MKHRFWTIAVAAVLLAAGVGAQTDSTPVRVGVYQNYPLTFIEPDGTVRGFFIDILEHVAGREGWDISYRPQSWAECLDSLQNGDIDLLGVIAYSQERDRWLDYTYESLLTEWGQIYVADGSDIDSILDLEGKKVAVLSDDRHFLRLRELVAKFDISCRFIEAFEYEDVLMLVDFGRCQAGLVSNFYGNQYARNYAVTRSAILLSPERLYFATAQGRNRHLLDALDTALQRLKLEPESVYHASMERWFELGPRSTIGRWLWWLVAGASGLVVIFLLTSVVLQAQVKSKTRELVQKNLELMGEIDSRKIAETALRESEKKFYHLFESSPIWMALATLEDGRFIEVNQEFVRQTGYTKGEVIGRTPTDFGLWEYPEERSGIIRRIQESGKLDAFPVQFRMKDGTLKDFLWSARFLEHDGVPCTLSGVIDITDRVRDQREKEKLREQLEQVRRLEAIGTLAGGVAHDFNNLLMGIQGNVSLAVGDIGHDDRIRERLQSIETHVRNASDLTRQLLGFARGGKYEVTPTAINDVISENSRMFGRTRKEITIRLELDPKVHTVEVDRGQIDQVLLNLYVNAWQAMPGGGRLTIRTRNVAFDGTEDKPFAVVAGPYVRIEVADTGVGMPEAVQKRIFDPFFTTKEKGRGTGLGLASAYGIIKNHNGYIEVESREGMGTAVRLYLPATDKPVRPPKQVPETVDPGSGTVLLIDDEEMVLKVGREMLKRLGYTVHTARSGLEAVRLFADASSAIDLVILDVIMPHMSGAETYDRLRAIDPEAKVLVSSGYSLDGQAKDILNSGGVGFIQKPFSVEQLSRKIRDILK